MHSKISLFIFVASVPEITKKQRAHSRTGTTFVGATFILCQIGFKKVFVYKGGYKEWNENNYPWEK